MKDEYKRARLKDYTAFDIGFRKSNSKKQWKKFQRSLDRKARRTMKMKLKKEMEEMKNEIL